MSRDDLIGINAKVIDAVGEGIKKHAPDAFVIVITNPLDAMVGRCRKSPASGATVVGMAGVLDSARFRYFLAEEFNVSVEDVTAFVLGGHGDTMVPLVRYSTVGRHPAARPGQDGLDHPGAARRRSSSAPATAAPRSWPAEDRLGLLRAGRVGHRDGRDLPQGQEAHAALRRHLNGEYGVKDLYIGVPVVIGAGGVERIVEIELNAGGEGDVRQVGGRREARCATRSSSERGRGNR